MYTMHSSMRAAPNSGNFSRSSFFFVAIYSVIIIFHHFLLKLGFQQKQGRTWGTVDGRALRCAKRAAKFLPIIIFISRRGINNQLIFD